MSAWFTFIASSRTHISYLVSFGLRIVLTSVFIYIYSVYLDCVLNNIEGVRIPCLCILYSNTIIKIYARTLGSFLISFRALFVHLIFFGSLDCLLHPLKFLHRFILVAIFDPQYSLISSKYSSLD